LRLVEDLRSQPVLYRRIKGSALINLSELLVLRGKPEDGQEAAVEAVELLQPLAESAGESDQIARYQWLYAMALTDRGVASRLKGDRVAAARDFDLAERVCLRVPKNKPEYDDTTHLLACVFNQRGYLLAGEPRALGEALNAFQKAAELLDKLIAGHPAIPHHREERADGLIGSAGIHLSANRTQRARQDCESAKEYVQKLMDGQRKAGAPDSARLLSLLGRALELSSRVHFSQGDRAQALKDLSAAIANLDRCVALDPRRIADKSLAASIKRALEAVQTQTPTPKER
jgi:hypothetical protein